MSWIDTITDFCKNTLGTADQNEQNASATNVQQGEKFRQEANQIWSFEPETDENKTLTPREHGTKLLKLTKERALRRIRENEQQAQYSSR